MQDIIYVAIPIAFFAMCVAYVRGLDRLVRRGERAEGSSDVSDRVTDERVGVAS